MSLFDFFFPDQAQAQHLREMARLQRLEVSRGYRHRNVSEGAVADLRQDLKDAHQAIDQLRDEIGQAALVIEALLEKLEEKEIASRSEIAALAQEVDGRDGTVDGKITEDGMKLKFSPNRD